MAQSTRLGRLSQVAWSTRLTWLNSVSQLNFLAALFRWHVAALPALKHIRDKNSIHHNAVKFAECLFEKIETLNDKEVDSIVSRPLLDAARYGAYELMSQLRHQLMISKDSSGNTMLHLAGKLAPQNKLNLVSGPALQMQRELQWFKVI
ncbi:hypothetical protein RND71_026320 [Anisodus tanguticus]|uniref:Uncharacterized protein n=1 Tax=Anisodus tanguticus TaxID=243964 RepID=A0AAE1RNC5_9SOLA|nr:hypothetical protein RND71_026320 [Anisodus tanguticus]